MITKDQLLEQNRDRKCHDFDSAVDYLIGGKNPELYRPLYDRGLVLRRIDDTTMAITFTHQTSFQLVTYKPNGVVILPSLYGYHRVRPATRRAMANYANLIGIDYKKRKYYIHRQIDPKKPIKFRRCTSCSGQGFNIITCNGIDGYKEVTQFSGKSIMLRVICTMPEEDVNRYSNHREKQACAYCTAGKVQVGGKPIPTEWDARKPLRLDIVTGYILDDEEPTVS
jgi:hypothetical protein